MSVPSDDPLASHLTAVARREEGALHALYDEFSPRLFGLALRITRKRVLAEQTLRDAFVAIWQEAGSYDAGHDDALAWIVARVRTRALSALAGSLPRNAPVDTPIEELDRRTLDRLIDEKPAHLLRSTLKTLPDGDRRAILLAYLDGADYDEISLRLDIAPSSAMSWIRRGLYRLKQTGL